jgi:uncharacterized protein with HEPN domain
MDRAKKDLSILKHILEHCSEIVETHNVFGNDYEIFQKSRPYFKAIAMDLLQIGELTNHLSKEFQENYKSIPYSAIISLRNIVAHGYGRLNAENVWKISKQDTSVLQKLCLEIINEIEQK